MSYVALYRKFRPDTFEEVKGQDHIVQALRNQVLHDHVGHAYLFCGTRGTGKTTLAKLLAKAVNCDNPSDGNPCGKCDSCRAVSNGRSTEIIEIDAASNNSVDNIRQITESVQYSPTAGKYLVYIIDEVHMLTTQAFNALLKTLEEPPDHVIFILATTDDQKVPATIQSRCQRYDFHRISVETITARLSELTEREGVDADCDALRYIARAADGSMRDALSILDQCISTQLSEKLTFESVLATVGAVEIDVYVKLMKAICDENGEEVLNIVNDAVWKGKELTKFTDDFVWFLRNMYFLKYVPDMAEELDLTREDAGEIVKLGNEVSTETLTRFMNHMEKLSHDIRFSTIKRITLEMALISLMHPETETSYEAVYERLGKLENENENLKEKINSLEKSKNEISKAISSGSLSISSEGLSRNQQESVSDIDEKKTNKEISDKIVKNMKESMNPATYDDLMQIARDWNVKILPKLKGPAKKYTEKTDLVPDEGYNVEAGDIPKLKLIYTYGINEEKPDGLRYYEMEQNRERISEDISEILNRRVEITAEGRTVNGVEKQERFMNCLNKIQFDDLKIEG